VGVAVALGFLVEGSAAISTPAEVGEKVGREGVAVGVALGAAVEGSAVGAAVGETVATELQSLRSLAVMLHHSKRAKRNPAEPVCWTCNAPSKAVLNACLHRSAHVRHMYNVLSYVRTS